MRWLRGKATSGELEAPLVWACAALAVCFAPHVLHFPAWITAATIAAGVWRYTAERRRWHLPPLWLRALLVFAALAGVLALYAGINGVVPGTALLALMAALKILETHRRRDLHVVLFIALFLSLSSLLREQALWSLPYLAVALFCCLVAWQQVAREGTPLPIRVVSRGAGRIARHAVPLLIAFWVLFPRVPGAFWAVPTQGEGASTGISDRIEPGSIAALIASEAVAFRVEFSGELPPLREMYWRGPVMEAVVGRAWQVSDFPPMNRRDTDVIYTGQSYRYRMTLQPTGQRWLFGLDVPETWNHPGARMSPTQQLMVRQPIDKRLVTELRSYTRFKIGGDLSPRSRDRLTYLPGGSNPKTRQLAKDLRAASRDEQEFIAKVLAMFANDNFVYTLKPPPLGLNSMDEFLFTTRAGFCEHYASAFATLMRAGGIPARLIGGYQGGELNPLGGYWIVRQSDAHAWVEIWTEDDGWVRVDPTAAVSSVRLESGLDAALRSTGQSGLGRWLDFEWLTQAGFTWDALNARWDEWVLGYGPETQQRFMRWLGMDDPRWERLATMLGIVTALILAVIALRLARLYAKPQPDEARRAYERVLRRLRITVAPHESATIAAERIAERYPSLAGDAARFVDHYQAIRYAGVDTIESLRREAGALISAARSEPATTTTHR
ncbi:MAG: DUF3488 and transglutaminase-like domain-containing protein [Pseudomonadota bacterium]